ncbi:LOW QUALITY PROTEIN: UDP-N-acetylmuramoylalanyl-D-glutamyl-2,6-diaminopimelate--D-alanyl-D-alanine ligase [Bacillus sp. JCM 19047]|nr:LOW QUALITY PROTEIN: UDP-N-acetylmuramoylalanyl-D-glutamyl-2,6-diaminopimelate--D-alanyl-D-alanine ligase [Bacillus sp. JCM 19047]
MIEARLVESVANRTRLQDGPVSFHSVTTDSRNDSKTALFVPLSGERFNGHHYLESAIESGAIAAIWQENEPVPMSIPASFQLYFVDDPLHALQELAQRYRDEVNPYVIGITGSNGKTTTKDIVFQLLGGEPFVHRTAGNLNNHIGVPLTLLSMPKECKFAVVEMGMNHAGEISLLSKLAKPDLAIVTNIAKPHIEHLGSRQGIANAKMEMLDGLKQGGFLVLDGDEPLLDRFQQEQTVSIGFNKQNKEAIATFQPKADGFTFSFLNEQNWYLPLLGEHNVKNAAYAIWIARQVGLATETIKERLAHVTITGMRLRKQDQMGQRSLMMRITQTLVQKRQLKRLKRYLNSKRRIIVLGDIYELGPDEQALHRSVASAIDTPITNIVCVGEKGYWIYDEVKQQNGSIAIEHVEKVADVAEKIRPLLKHDTVVLLKASRRLALEQVLSAVKGGA